MYPLRKFEQFPAQKTHQNLRWPAQIWPGLPRCSSAISALGRAVRAVRTVRTVRAAAEQKKNGQKI